GLAFDSRDRPFHGGGRLARQQDRECRRGGCLGCLGGRACPRQTASRPRWTARSGRAGTSRRGFALAGARRRAAAGKAAYWPLLNVSEEKLGGQCQAERQRRPD